MFPLPADDSTSSDDELRQFLDVVQPCAKKRKVGEGEEMDSDEIITAEDIALVDIIENSEWLCNEQMPSSDDEQYDPAYYDYSYLDLDRYPGLFNNVVPNSHVEFLPMWKR